MTSLAERVGKRAARELGFELKRIIDPAAKCLNLTTEARELLATTDGEVKDFLTFCIGKSTLSRSQILQDLFVAFETDGKRDGFFVEFGGTDGVTGSNSYMLENTYGWAGIVAEPARGWHPALNRNRGCTIDYRCVSDRSGERVIFNEAERPELSTIDRFSRSDQYAAVRRRGNRYPVETVSLNDLLDEHDAPATFDYLSIDTEGSELTILSAFDFDAHRPRIITVEHNHSPAREQLHSLLESKGYRRKFDRLSQVDDWYVLAS
ncbi:FkbM family methyltransferase [Sphingomonas bacterium]|uniref:FkbM family methyltransferase n=1 Tax=Sphingomonas bacterium TaxID=1895847 RepID=UPI001575E679|nr:FkbM family methyltransferase [Sphingomonas bacterium]